MNKEHNRQLAVDFIERLWNERDFAAADEILHSDYRDHSFLPQVPPTKEGLLFWITNTSKSFDHHTKIESIVADEDTVALRIIFEVTHIGLWRGIEPTGTKVPVKGFRYFTVRDGKIVSQHALIDGETLYTQLTQMHQGCTIQ
jgi:predicted SnoaL-like aldol condensation-catalyzing enzyme